MRLLLVERAPAFLEHPVEVGGLELFQFCPLVEWSARKNAVSGSPYPGVVFIVMSKSLASHRLIHTAYSTFSISALMPMRFRFAATTGAPLTIVGNVGMTQSLTVKPSG